MAKAKDPHWIEKATAKNKGKLRAETGTKPGQDISSRKLAAAERSKNLTERREANLAAELNHFRHGK